MTDDEQKIMIEKTHDMVEEIRRDFYTARPSDGTTLLVRVARMADWLETMGKIGRVGYWVTGVIAAIVIGWAAFKDSLVRILSGSN